MDLLLDPLLSAVPSPFARAVRAGFSSDRVGTAFLEGYRAALWALVPSLGPPHRPVLAATEVGPVHPREVRTAIAADGRLTGHKRYLTGAPGADRAVVLARAGTEGERLKLVAAVVDLEGPGVRLTPMPATAFVPEVPHAELHLDGAPALAVLPGDGWAAVVRPFRTVEDIHVLGAVTGYLLGVARRSGWGEAPTCALMGALAGLGALAGMDASAPGTHLALAGALAGLREILATLPWSEADPDEAARWQRDAPLLAVAEGARRARLEAAWERLRAG